MLRWRERLEQAKQMARAKAPEARARAEVAAERARGIATEQGGKGRVWLDAKLARGARRRRAGSTGSNPPAAPPTRKGFQTRSPCDAASRQRRRTGGRWKPSPTYPSGRYRADCRRSWCARPWSRSSTGRGSWSRSSAPSMVGSHLLMPARIFSPTSHDAAVALSDLRPRIVPGSASPTIGWLTLRPSPRFVIASA